MGQKKRYELGEYYILSYLLTTQPRSIPGNHTVYETDHSTVNGVPMSHNIFIFN